MFINKDGVEIKTISDDGETVETIQTTGAEKNIEVGFNVKYLIDALNAFNEEKVFVCVNDEISPACIYSNKNNKHKQLAIVMPMRV
jgi:DNA polymerase-3 subunit beta